MSDPPGGLSSREATCRGRASGLDGHVGAEGGANKVTAVDADFGQRIEHVINRGKHAARPPRRLTESTKVQPDYITFPWFDFAWVLAGGTPAPFTVVDIAELTDDGLIASLHIVDDTSPIRADFEQATRNRKP
jgi:hypothetical protein